MAPFLTLASNFLITTGAIPILHALVGSKTVVLDYGNFTAARTDTYYAFKGVKYGDAPTGSLRWAKPVSPPTKNLGQVNATDFGPGCISGRSTGTTNNESEDCLFGNIYIPLTTTDEKLPVMVWFHGGGYRGGVATADPQSLFKASAKSFIFVSFNYRLAQFGFLGGAKINASGRINAGLEDQRAALRWVRRYIEKFGGDPTKVTLWGQSAGGGSIMFHLLANHAADQHLFRGAITDSPVLTFTPKFDDPHVEGIFKNFAEEAGCGDAGDSLDCLRKAKVEDLVAAGPKTQAIYKDTVYLFEPVYGGFFASQPPIESFQAKKFVHVPVLTGSNTRDGFGSPSRISDPAANTSSPGANENTVFNFLKGQYDSLDKNTFNKLVKEYPLSAYNNSVNRQADQMYGEVRFICNAAQMAGSEHDAGVKAYHYRYNAKDSAHGAELDAILSTTDSGDPAQDAMVLQMREYWTSFVTDGAPSATGAGAVDWASNPVSDGLGNHRLVFTPGNLEFEDISEQLQRCEVWYKLASKVGI